MSSATAEARAVVGDIVVDAACVYQYRTATWATLYEQNANGWQCISNEWKATDHRSVDMSRECRRNYGASAYADYLDFNNPYSWRCFIDSANF
ncbi:hypothetical protein FK535_00495 [Mycolicibacterium sp. 018/SC-01/001]|uniref:hypothetical protein n=1 Tax=Mycolicibacterium sp. 018/SC-01/001 TaxID=2592069 RepID=UPI00118161F8|nr:hypothetical protein [Mycolicibacterium sp. 018/SC-01/001]TRW88801.1 hypothetical protein FK535_00495 [Mycolicibacterium sp. 018/SC-01/001]